MAAPGVILSYSIAVDVPPLAVLDPLRIKQVIVNGLTNALKYTKKGYVVLQVRTVRNVHCVILRESVFWTLHMHT